MPIYDPEFLQAISKDCYSRFQPQPLVDLLNQRGIVGRTAEVFWTYFQHGLENGTFECQISNAYVAEMLYTDVRTVQRANEKLVAARLIRRDRAKRNFNTVPIEAPAITAISIPDPEAEAFLCQAPRRDHESTEQTGDN